MLLLICDSDRILEECFVTLNNLLIEYDNHKSYTMIRDMIDVNY